MRFEKLLAWAFVPAALVAEIGYWAGWSSVSGMEVLSLLGAIRSIMLLIPDKWTQKEIRLGRRRASPDQVRGITWRETPV